MIEKENWSECLYWQSGDCTCNNDQKCEDIRKTENCCYVNTDKEKF